MKIIPYQFSIYNPRVPIDVSAYKSPQYNQDAGANYCLSLVPGPAELLLDLWCSKVLMARMYMCTPCTHT